MKHESQHLNKYNQNKTNIIQKYTRPVAYFIILLLFYTFGYISSTVGVGFSSLANIDRRAEPQLQTDIDISPPEKLTPATIPAAKPPAKLLDFDQFKVKTRCSTQIPPQVVRQTILQHLFNNTSPYTNFPPAHVSDLIRPTRIKGWGSTGLVFENLIRKVKPNTIIEVGTFLGASALHMASLTRSLGLETQILCVDDFRGWAGFKTTFKDMPLLNGDVLLLYQFMQNVIHMNKTESILPLPFSTSSALDMLCDLGVKGDLIEIDAGHDFISAWTDINRAYRILSPGGVIFGHDYFHSADNKGVRRAVNLFARVNRLRVRVDGQHWVID